MFELATLLAAIVPACNFSIGLGPAVTPGTGQRPLALRLVNRGRATCHLRGYPSVVLEDRAGRIPFVVSHRGDQMVTNKRPVPVVVTPGRAAFVLLNHYRCDRGDLRTATLLRIGSSTLRLSDPFGAVSWCGKGDPGSVLAVSPFEPTLKATSRFG